jgi:acyl carrier protein
VEQVIAEIWHETLGIAQVGVLDNFFTDLNGSSLLATQVTSQLRKRFQVDLPLRRFFEGPTVGELAAFINSQRESELGTLPVKGILDRTYA